MSGLKTGDMAILILAQNCPENVGKEVTLIERWQDGWIIDGPHLTKPTYAYPVNFRWYAPAPCLMKITPPDDMLEETETHEREMS